MSYKKRFIVKLLLILSFCSSFFAVPSTTFACSCPLYEFWTEGGQLITGIDYDEHWAAIAFQDSDAVFTGKIVKIEDSDEMEAILYFEVFESWKGVETFAVAVEEPLCVYYPNVSFEIGKPYIVYARTSANDNLYQLRIGNCSPTKYLSSAVGDQNYLSQHPALTLKPGSPILTDTGKEAYPITLAPIAYKSTKLDQFTEKNATLSVGFVSLLLMMVIFIIVYRRKSRSQQ